MNLSTGRDKKMEYYNEQQTINITPIQKIVNAIIVMHICSFIDKLRKRVDKDIFLFNLNYFIFI